MATKVGTDAGFYGRSLHGRIQTGNNENLDMTRDVYRYQILYVNVVTLLDAYLKFFSSGEYSNLKTSLTLKTANTLTMVIQNSNAFYNDNIDNLTDFEYNPDTFDNFRNNTFFVLNGMIQALSQYDQLDALKNEVKECQAVLSSESSILAFLEANRQMSALAFSANQTYNTEVILKPWYEKYLMTYGAPNDGIFDTSKMAAIVDELVTAGIITLEQFRTNTYP
jgi:hypothetical protein